MAPFCTALSMPRFVLRAMAKRRGCASVVVDDDDDDDEPVVKSGSGSSLKE